MEQKQPLSWEFLSQFNFNNPPSMLLGRTDIVEDKYSKHKENLKSKNIKINDYLIDKLFKDSEHFKFVENDFPYNVEQSINHYVFWLNPEFKDKYNEIKIKKMLNFIIQNDFIIFKNIPSNMSIPAITHYHVFFR